ncbi:6 [rice transitory yellowing virus]|uniref:Protein 6 n=1 Tax=Rice yellow stunt virus TaxID=59380 RepID=VP6_RYSV|nr:hypothetical protein RYSVgp6 [rice transitory yellowing virus]O70791.1 RecName: Full=Protein 6 [rice transitory yellowing virus]BAA25159.1 6 [Rice yellow stunt nucleorhabdovirus] [rice transitory yellowing virus]
MSSQQETNDKSNTQGHPETDPEGKTGTDTGNTEDSPPDTDNVPITDDAIMDDVMDEDVKEEDIDYSWIEDMRDEDVDAEWLFELIDECNGWPD